MLHDERESMKQEKVLERANDRQFLKNLQD